MIEMLAGQFPNLPRKAARKQAMSTIATMMGSLVMARIAGSGDFSDDILSAGREAILGRAKLGRAKSPGVKKSAPRKAATSVQH